ncbi:hypothetical protein [Spongiactinospora sp. TRM90649]|uniref:hypothetical protein n=1 Tax=Spongiactinospora sp. TRM90649 TaxID=3031114 RepID=UPI0023F80C6B|nr:hypothetical protein [Spongiactinospora sp. TRM90649]MDF5759122.1 hypothetical protein [Spongiactinospora sp. TRM90649]
MPQLRLMGDDPEHVEQVLAILLPLLTGDPRLIVGDPARLRHRGGGGRIVIDVSAAHRTRPEGPIRVRAERVDDRPAPGPAARPRTRRGPTPPALPPATEEGR